MGTSVWETYICPLSAVRLQNSAVLLPRAKPVPIQAVDTLAYDGEAAGDRSALDRSKSEVRVLS